MAVYRSTLTLFILLGSLSTFAQSSSESEERVEKISVTGSFIKKIDVQGVAPLETINNEEFTKRGAVEIGDVFRETPAFESVYSDGGNVRFRGQNAGNVLILLNGLRLPKYNGGYYTSVRDLPTAVIDRVEMLKDSGSATYGSDAMSGVLNFITKQDYEGAEVSAGVSRAEMGSEGMQQTYSATYGKNFSRGNIMGVVQFEKTNAIHELDLGSYDSEGNPTQKTSYVTANNTDVAGATAGCPGTAPCEPSSILYRQARPKNNDISALLTGKYDFDDFTLSVVGIYNRNKTTALSSPQRANWTINLSDMDNTSSYYSTADNYDNSGELTINGRFVDELGDYVTEQERNVYSLQVGANGYFSSSSDWSWNVQTGLSLVDTTDTVVSGEADEGALTQLFLDGDFNVFAGQGNKSDVSSAKFNPEYNSTSTLMQTRVVFSGDLFDLGKLYNGGGYISMATGAEVIREDYETENDASLSNGTALSQTSENYSIDREIVSGFVEFSASPISEVEINLATRFDHYSDMGDTFNPKLGLSYRPWDFVLFRTTVGTGFRAPGISDVAPRETTSDSSCFDSQCTGTYSETSYNMSDLGPEKSLSYNFGAIFQPFKGFSFIVDQWNYESEDTITSVSNRSYVQVEEELGSAAVESLGASITRDGSGDIVSMRVPNVTNIGEQTIRGLDVQADYRYNVFKDFDMKIGSSWMFIFDRKRQRFSFEDEQKFDSSWKNRTFVSLFNSTHFARIAMVMTGKDIISQGYNDEIQVKRYEEFDFTYSYSWKWGGKLNFTVKNIFNSRPQANTNSELVRYGWLSESSSSYSPLRRRYYVGYTHTF